MTVVLMLAATACSPSTFVDYDGDLAGCMGDCRVDMKACRDASIVVLEGCVYACSPYDIVCHETCALAHFKRDNQCLDDASVCMEICIYYAEEELR